MGNLFWKEPENLEENTKLFVELQSTLHNIELDFSDKESFFIKRLEFLKQYMGSKIDTIIEYTESLEHQNRLCHGDFHPGNILIGKDGPYVIDWMLGNSSHPFSDVCRTYLMMSSPVMYKNAPEDKQEKIKNYLGTFNELYIKEYCNVNNVLEEDIFKWLLPVATLRLMERIPHEEEWLLKIIDGELNKKK